MLLCWHVSLEKEGLNMLWDLCRCPVQMLCVQMLLAKDMLAVLWDPPEMTCLRLLDLPSHHAIPPGWHVAGEHKLFGEHQKGRKLGLSGNEWKFIIFAHSQVGGGGPGQFASPLILLLWGLKLVCSVHSKCMQLFGATLGFAFWGLQGCDFLNVWLTSST